MAISYVAMFIPLAILWTRPYGRALLMALVIFEGPGILLPSYWLFPRLQALHRISFDEFLARSETLRTSPRRPFRVRVVSSAVSLSGLVVMTTSVLLFFLGPKTPEYVFDVAYFVAGAGLMLFAASTTLTLPLYSRFDEVVIGKSFVDRLRLCAVAFALAGLVYIGLSVVHRLGLMS